MLAFLDAYVRISKKKIGIYSNILLNMHKYFPNISGHEDQTYVQWMWLYKDVPKRCECGHWYKLYHVEPFVDESILAMSDVH